MTLTNRLLLFFLATLAVVLVGFSLTLYLLARTYLRRQADERLEAALNTLVAAVEVTAEGVEWEPGERVLRVGQGPLGAQAEWLVSDEQGRVVDRSAGAAAGGLLAEAAEALSEQGRPARRFTWEGQRWQVSQMWLRSPTPLAGRMSPPRGLAPGPKHEGESGKKYPALAVTVGIPFGPVRATLRVLAGALAGLSLAVWASALLAGRWVCRRALAPVGRMASAARSMSAADLAARLPLSGSRDELDDLGRAFNELLDRLGESFERQRRFTGDASHQLRTPLTAILGQVEVALRRPRPPEEYERVLAAVQRQALGLRQIVESLLFLARADAEARLPELERLDLAEWLPRHLASWSAHPRAGDVTWGAEGEGPWRVAAQPALLAELVNNLLENAGKYSALGSPITLRLGRGASAGVILAVEDRGCGVAEEELPRVFEPFFRSAEARRRGTAGVGLGLAVAARLAKAFGGRIEARSRPGHGSAFTVHFPADGQEPH